MKNLLTTSIGHVIIIAIIFSFYALIPLVLANENNGYVMVIKNTDLPIESWEYIGHFKNCHKATIYQQITHPNAVETKCLLEEYMVFPKDIAKVFRDVK